MNALSFREQLIRSKLDELADNGHATIPLHIILDIKLALGTQKYTVETTYEKRRVQSIVVRL